jgi:hypothetical protein
MASCARGLTAALVLVLSCEVLIGAADAKIPVVWARKRQLANCEPPHVFYSSHHVAGQKPCCTAVEGICAGGEACPPSGVCASDGKTCVPGAVADRPNIILFISDDQGYCHYGNADECRSTQTGTPVPAPRTPNLDVLAAHGTVFPIAHNTASWCFPSLASILTGRYQKNFHGQRKVTEAFFTMLPNALRGLAGDVSTTPDPYNPGNKIGGYCTLLAGKFTGSLDESAFDGVAKTGGRRLGRNDCIAGAPGQAPLCGTAAMLPYAPFTATNTSDVFNFLDMLVYKQPDSVPAQYAMQHFFIWYAPRVPHQPLRSPPPVIDYLFGGVGALGGVMDLGQWCSGPACAPVVSAFNEDNFGTVREYFGNIWWADDNVRELRRFLAEETAAHCIGPDGRSRFDVANASQCGSLGGTWSTVTPDLERNTILIYLSDNGWHLPNSKHAYTENGYRTQILVYDPRTLPTLPSWDATLETPGPALFNPALAHSVDILPTVVGFASGTSGSQDCPISPDGFTCDGKDLGAHLVTAPGGPAAPETLRHAICGHHTKRTTSPTRSRYLLTRPGSVGRCTKPSNPACTTAADCGAGQFCAGGFCATDAGSTGCSTNAQCTAGAACLGGKCRMAPACADDSDCTGLVGPGYVCGGKAEKWCRNAPNATCSTNDDCPVCPTVGASPVPCSRLCEARSLKLYVNPGAVASVQLADLFLDPDEQGLATGDPSTLVGALSNLGGPYGGTIRRMNCCIDDWWPEIVGESGTQCTLGFSCPADLKCE